MTKRRLLLMRLALVAAGLLLALVVVEIGLRIVGVSFPSLYAADPVLGYRLRPGVAGTWRKEGRSEVRITSDGRRDRERPVAKPAGACRVVVLGDSYVEALQVPVDRALCAVMEQHLRACRSASCDVEVLGFGVSGYGTAQELLLLRDRAWRYEPDLVVLAFTTGNDVRNDSKALEPDGMRPFFVLEGDRLVLDSSFLESRAYRARSSLGWRVAQGAMDHSRLLQLLNEAKNARAARQGADAGLDDAVYSMPADPRWADAWAVTEALLREVRDECASHGVPLLVATLSSPIQVDPHREAREAWASARGIADLLAPDRRIEAACRRDGIACVVLADGLRAEAEASGRCLHGFPRTPCSGHWNEEGHAVAGKLLAAAACPLLGSPGAPAARPPHP